MKTSNTPKTQPKKAKTYTAKGLQKTALHPRNAHRQGYDFTKLVKVCPQLKQYFKLNQHGYESFDFSHAEAVLLLNQTLLKTEYGIAHWILPKGYLCPPIPGRVDYIHYIADLLKLNPNSKTPVGHKVRGLDIGTGANSIYPLLGSAVYGWRFVASDIEPASIAAAKNNIEQNPQVASLIECRQQLNKKHIFKGIIQPKDYFDFSLCNPPFHVSKQAAQQGSKRKVSNLQGKRAGQRAALNFGGQHNELWCQGGERAFILQMIKESQAYKQQCYWFTSLVSKKDNLYPIKVALKKAGVAQSKVVAMAQGNKVSRFVAWSYYQEGVKAEESR